MADVTFPRKWEIFLLRSLKHPHLDMYLLQEIRLTMKFPYEEARYLQIMVRFLHPTELKFNTI